MNYLAHVYLSFGDAEVLTGNLISDFVKGNKKYQYAPGIQKGINLHREIDAFTDSHMVNKEAAKIFKPVYRLYSAALLDVVYDHFLALELAREGQERFMVFTTKAYNDAGEFAHVFPQAFANIFPYMKAQNWLYNYQHLQGIEKSLDGLFHRARYMPPSATAMSLFKSEYEMLKHAYSVFFPELKNFTVGIFSDIH